MNSNSRGGSLSSLKSSVKKKFFFNRLGGPWPPVAPLDPPLRLTGAAVSTTRVDGLNARAVYTGAFFITRLHGPC